MHVSEILQAFTHFRDHSIVVRFVAALGITITISVARPTSVLGSTGAAPRTGVAGSLIIDTAFWIPLRCLVATFLVRIFSPGDYCQEADHAEG